MLHATTNLSLRVSQSHQRTILNSSLRGVIAPSSACHFCDWLFVDSNERARIGGLYDLLKIPLFKFAVLDQAF